MKLIYHSPVKPREFSRTQLCKDPRWCEKNVMGSGPFTFAEYQLGQSIKGVRNPDYYRQGLPYLDVRARQRGILTPSLGLFFHSRPCASPGSRDIPPFLSIRLKCDHRPQSMTVAEECRNCRPEATFHNWVNLWQSLTLELWRDPSPVFF
jgi:hypothetical protein